MTMEIYIAKSAGFCFGVKRAINIAVASADSNKGGDIHTLGPIIHNPQVVETLEKTANITAKDSLDDIKGGTVIIRSHGVKYEEINEAKRKGLNIVDATCPFVKKTHELVSELTADGYFVVVVGEKEHPEVQGMVSYGASADIVVVAGVEGLKAIGRKKKIGIVAQTTQSESRFREIAEFCRTIADEVKVCNTICSATSVRQEDSVEISRLVDCVIVVGGKNSANTRRLAEICRGIQPNTHHIEIASEISTDWFKGVNKLGISAGASTPDWIIEEVVNRVLESFDGAVIKEL